MKRLKRLNGFSRSSSPNVPMIWLCIRLAMPQVQISRCILMSASLTSAFQTSPRGLSHNSPMLSSDFSDRTHEQRHPTLYGSHCSTIQQRLAYHPIRHTVSQV